MKLLWVDFLRVIAVFAVIIGHSSAYPVIFIKNKASLDWWAANFFDAAIRWSVPVFVMISGSLLLAPSKKESVSIFLKKRASKIIIPLIFWTIFSFFFLSINNTINIKFIAYRILLAEPYAHLYYLYMIFGLYLITPFLRTYVSYSSYKERSTLIGFILVFASFCVAKKYFIINNPTITFIFVPYIGYYLWGYNLKLTNINRISTKYLLLIIISCLALSVCGAGFFTNYFELSKGLFFYDFFSPFIAIMAGCIFLLFRKLFSDDLQVNEKVGFIIQKISSTALGIYIIHLFIIDATIIYFKKIPTISHTIWTIPLFSIVIFFISFLIVLFIKKIPFVKNIV